MKKIGMVVYKRVEEGVSKSIDAPVKEFIGDDFVVGVWFLTTVFGVSQPPTLVDGEWSMVVDGVILTRSL